MRADQPARFRSSGSLGANGLNDPAYQHKKDAMHFEVPRGKKGKKSATGAHP